MSEIDTIVKEGKILSKKKLKQNFPLKGMFYRLFLK